MKLQEQYYQLLADVRSSIRTLISFYGKEVTEGKYFGMPCIGKYFICIVDDDIVFADYQGYQYGLFSDAVDFADLLEWIDGKMDLYEEETSF